MHFTLWCGNWLYSCIIHTRFGKGRVMRYEGDDKMVILFDTVGYKTLAVDLTIQQGLIKQVG